MSPKVTTSHQAVTSTSFTQFVETSHCPAAHTPASLLRRWLNTANQRIWPIRLRVS